VQLIGASSGVVSDRYHPAICAAVLGKPAQVLSNRERHKMHGLKDLLARHTLEELQDRARAGLSVLRDALRSAV
jgi:polysaccharide pyruvyl transferase WcaK-like protein